MNDADARGNRATGLAILWGVLVTLLAGWNLRGALDFDFLAWGDDLNITLTAGWPPVFGLGHAVAGLSPKGYHAVNLALHAGNALLLYALILRLLRRWGSAADDRWAVCAAGVGALGWALHPMRAAAVGWASALPVGVATGLTLAAVQVGWSARGTSAVRLFLAALLAAPALLLYPTAGSEVQVLWPQAPDVAELNVFDRGMRSVAAIAVFLVRSVSPWSLSPAPTTFLGFSGGEWRGWASLILLGGLTWVAWRHERWRRLWFVFLALTLPALGFGVQQYFPCDHFAHVATMVLAVATAQALARAKPGPWRDWTGFIAVGLLLALLVGQRFTLAPWRDNDALFERIAREADDEDYYTATYRRWALAHAERGELEEARDVLLRATRAGVAVEKVYAMLDETGNFARPGMNALARKHEQLALAAATRMRLRDAREHFEAALALAPRAAGTRLNFAMTCLLADDLDLALHLYLRATANPEAAAPAERLRVARALAKALHLAGRTQLAWRLTERALPDAPQPVEPALREEFERYRRGAMKRALG